MTLSDPLYWRRSHATTGLVTRWSSPWQLTLTVTILIIGILASGSMVAADVTMVDEATKRIMCSYVPGTNKPCSDNGACEPGRNGNASEYHCLCDWLIYEADGTPSGAPQHLNNDAKCTYNLWQILPTPYRIFSAVNTTVYVILIAFCFRLFWLLRRRGSGTGTRANASVNNPNGNGGNDGGNQSSNSSSTLSLNTVAVGLVLVHSFLTVTRNINESITLTSADSPQANPAYRFFFTFLPNVPLITSYNLVYLFWRHLTRRTLSPGVKFLGKRTQAVIGGCSSLLLILCVASVASQTITPLYVVVYVFYMLIFAFVFIRSGTQIIPLLFVYFILITLTTCSFLIDNRFTCTQIIR
jgi:hypothetical protein